MDVHRGGFNEIYSHIPLVPLDLSVKQQQQLENNLTPPTSPFKKRSYDEEIEQEQQQFLSIPLIKEVTPKKYKKSIPSQKNATKLKDVNPATVKERKHKAVRKLKFDEKKSSPVSGTVIRPLEEIMDTFVEKVGDIDPQYNVVEVTDEAKEEISNITNVIGNYICKLCRNEYDDVFGLARHQCACIILLEYRCPECSKLFNCPANLASHRRWHRPKDQIVKKQQEISAEHECFKCGKFFKRHAYLKKHLLTHQTEDDKKICFSELSNSNSSESAVYNGVNENQVPQHFMRNCFDHFTEEENLAAEVLSHLSVIKHTTALVV